MLLVRGIVKLGIDSYMFTLFYQTFFYFVRVKRSILRNIYGPRAELNIQNQMVIFFTMFLWALNIVFSLLVAVVWGVFQSSIVQNDP
jgi:hypothetical protein